MAGYVLVNIESFLRMHPNAKVLLIHYPVNPEAPFQLNAIDGVESITYQSTHEQSISNQINAFDPEVIFCSGWTNGFYLSIVKAFKQAKNILGFDNHWRGTFKQHMLTLTAKWHVLNWFQYVWLPGQPQLTYALKMGFKPESCFTGLYPGDVRLFSAIASSRFDRLNTSTFPKVMISPFCWEKLEETAF